MNIGVKVGLGMMGAASAAFIVWGNWKMWEYSVQAWEKPVIQRVEASEAADVAESRRREDALARKVLELQYQLDILTKKKIGFQQL